MKISSCLRSALAPSHEAEVDGDLRAMGTTAFAEDVVYVHAWRSGEALLWDNHRVLHSTTPLTAYEPGARRLMWQVICKTA